MDLVLEIVNEVGDARESPRRESPRRKVFDSGGGRIGRAPDCDWVLPSPYVSRHHATVSHIDGAYYIESTGENGVALNEPGEMLTRFERHVLRTGDRLFIDEFEISVEVAGSTERVPFAPTSGFESAPGLSLQTLGPIDPIAEDLDPLRRLALNGSSAPFTATDVAPLPQAWNNSSSLADHFTPPQPQLPAGPALPIAEDWNHTSRDSASREAAPATANIQSRPARNAQPSSRGDFDSAMLCQALGLDPETFTPAMRSELAGFVRSMLQGLINERQARAQVSDQLRLRNSTRGISEQNPLRLAVNAQDAARLLFTPLDATQMSPTQAITDALDDVRAHQLATATAIRTAFQNMLSCFDPQVLQTRFDRHLRHAGVLPIGTKFRYWQLYAELFEQLATEHDGGFQQLFGEAFAGAYESQFNALKGNRASV